MAFHWLSLSSSYWGGSATICESAPFWSPNSIQLRFLFINLLQFIYIYTHIPHLLLCVFLYPIYSFTSDTRCVDFPHTKQFHNTSWLSYNLTQFLHYLPGDSVRSHGLRVQSHKTAPSLLQTPIIIPGCYLCF